MLTRLERKLSIKIKERVIGRHFIFHCLHVSLIVFVFSLCNPFQPQNLLLAAGPLPKVKIVDFGCATEISDSEHVIRQVFGNPEFSGELRVGDN